MSERFTRYASVEHLQSGLRRSAVRGGAATLSAQGVALVLHILSTAVLARLLVPDDFGLVAIAAAIIGVVLIIKDAGFAQAVVQRPEITHEQVSVLFWMNVGLSLAAAAVCAALAPILQLIYGYDQLVGIMLAMAGAVFIGSLAGIHRALMQRQMRLTSLSGAQVTALAGSIAIAVALAWAGAGYWALVAMQISRMAIEAAWVFIVCPWVPGLPRRGTGAGGMARFGAYMIGHSVIAYGGRNFDNLLVGGFLGAAVLGQYTRAYALLLFPIQQITGPVGRVAVPTLSRLVQLNNDRYIATYTRLVRLMAMVAIPGVATLIAIAHPLVRVLLGEGWALVPPTFQWLGLAAMVQPLTGTLSWLMIAEGRAKEQFYYSCIYFVLLMACFLIATPFGIIVLAAAYGITGVLIRSPLAVWLVLRRSPVGIPAFYRACAPGALAGLLAFVAGTGAVWLTTELPDAARVIIGAAAGGFAALLAYAIVPNWRTFLLHTRTWAKELKPGPKPGPKPAVSEPDA